MNTIETADILILYCEISVAIAGFAGIAGAIAKPQDELSKLRVQGVVTCAMPLLVFSFAALLLSATISSNELVWRSTSLIMFIWIAGYYVTHLGDVKTVFSASYIEKLIVAMDAGAATALLLNVLVLHSWELSTVYLACLFSWLIQACYFFYVSIESLWGNCFVTHRRRAVHTDFVSDVPKTVVQMLYFELKSRGRFRPVRAADDCHFDWSIISSKY